jgi:putative transposase
VPDFTGIDRGLSAYVVAATADGTELERVTSPRPLHRALPRVQRADRSVERKQRGSSNRRKANDTLRRLHGTIADRRHDFVHRTSTRLVKTHDELCLEDLAVSNLVRNRRLARHIADASWGELAQQIAYKAAWYGTDFAIAPRNFASTKTCSGCGWVHTQMSLKDRVFACRQCHLVVDRDLNAAVNLAAWANTEHASGIQAPDPEARGRVDNACGGTSAGHQVSGGETGPASRRPVRGKKQEPADAPTSGA